MTTVDVAVVGAGPAGLAAAVTAAEAGLSVVVIDAGQQPGGQYWRHPDETTAGTGRPPGQHDWKIYRALRARWDAAAIDYRPDTQVWFVEAGRRFTLRLTGSASVQASTLILCPGGYDRQLPVPGWDLPGVMAAGGVQALLKGSGTLARRRVVVGGTGPFLLPVAAGLAQAGATVVGVCEAGAVTGWLPQLAGAAQVPSKARDALTYTVALARHQVPYWTRTAVTAIHGTDAADAVTVTRLDATGRVRTGTERRLEVDLVALGWGFTPSLELLVAAGADTRLDVDGSLVAEVDARQRTSVPGVYAAGEVTGVGGALLAVHEGELAGLAAAADHGRAADAARVRRLTRAVRRSRAFARALHLAHPVPPQWSGWLADDTVVCRCEEVTAGEIRYARDELGADDPRTVKLMSRPGMGWCQGRVCGFATAQLAAPGAITAADLRPMAKRSLCAPVSLAELAACEHTPTP